MVRFIASYDLQSTRPDPHSEFLRQAIALGWSQWMPMANNRQNKLPNTTLQQSFNDIAAAQSSFNRAVSNTKQAINAVVNVEKLLIVQDGGSICSSNETK